MNKTTILICLFLYATQFNILFAQKFTNLEESYKFPSEINEKEWYANLLHANNGNFSRSVEISCNHGQHEISTEEIAEFKKYKPVPARKSIIEAAKKSRVVIINERHHRPDHRLFSESLLKGLKEIGFNYFGAETLDTENIDELNKRGYPTYNSGYYSVESMYGELIRTALHLDYELVAYEQDYKNNTPISSSKISPPEKPEIAEGMQDWEKDLLMTQFNMNTRDYYQAAAIAKILEENKDAKIFIHCGHGHNKEHNEKSWTTLAIWLKKMTGIDPLTIDQITLDFICQEYQHPIYKSTNIKESSVFINDKKELYSVPIQDLDFDTDEFIKYEYRDFCVAHPPVYNEEKYLNELMLSAGKQKINLNKKLSKINKPCLLFIYHKKEDTKESIPAYVKYWDSKEKDISVYLKKGDYKIMIKYQNETPFILSKKFKVK